MVAGNSISLAVALLVALICLAVVLRKMSIIRPEHGKLFADLVMKVTLPALIFVSLARQSVTWNDVALAAIMLAAELLCLALAWALGRMLKLEPPKMGAFMLTAGFGSSALLGYALISQIFPGQAAPLAEAVMISEVGVGPAMFTVGVMVAIYFGNSEVDARQRLRVAMGYFRSPIFFAIVAGIACAFFPIPWGNIYLGTLMKWLEILARANTLVVALTVGAALAFQDMKQVAVLALLVCVIKLFLKPIMLWLPALGLGMPEWQMQVLVLEGAMPSALLSVALCASYGCDAGLASRLVLATSVVSAGSIIWMVRLLG